MLIYISKLRFCRSSRLDFDHFEQNLTLFQQTLDGKEFVLEMVKDGFQFYMLDRIPLDGNALPSDLVHARRVHLYRRD
jgi:hypothetical protein